ncbi:MAG: thiamine pyrophosphate-binding protein [Betaproteobacteria bacterium]|jgi:acetolactate synthase-1/2/3 large subunit|nr:MAG: thiamine pyrophosphate-binding protein [Betaproteobacteria bacterium]
MPPTPLTQDTAAGVIARFLKARGVDRIFALCGGHIMPMWMRADAEGIEIVDVRDERAAVYMAHAHSELTGKLGVAMVTGGPGLTNAITGIANAHVARATVLVLSGVPPRAQENRGALQDISHTELVKSITRYARTVREPALVLQELDEAVSRAFGQGGEPGPVYMDFPTDTLRANVPKPLQMEEHFRAKPRSLLRPNEADVEAAVDLLWSARRPLIISGRGARGAGKELSDFLDRLGAVYLDTGESKGLVDDSHPSVVAAMRGKVMGDADLVVTVGRRLDFQLAYGSPAIFGDARFLRIGDSPLEIRDNRRGAVELFAQPAAALAAIVRNAGGRSPAVDRAWAEGLRAKHQERVEKLRTTMKSAPSDSEGRIHPNRLLAELQERLQNDAVVIADGGDFLSFSRVGLASSAYLDPGSFGCLGVGTPFGIAASLAFPGRQVVVATGDGSFGFNAMEIDTAVRHNAPVLIVVANNGAWQIEVHDQTDTHGKVVGTRLQLADYAQMARAFGMHAERVEKEEDLSQAIERAMANRPALLDVLVSPEARSSDAKTGLAWVPDLQPLVAWDEAERQWRDETN